MRGTPRWIAAPLLALFLLGIGAGAAVPAQAQEPPSARDDAGDRLSRIEQAMWQRDGGAILLLREWAAGDPSDRVRERSVGALALIRDAGAAPVFLGRLGGDPSPAVRRAAAEAIGLLRRTEDVRLLVDRLEKDPEPFVRAECARAIGRIANSDAIAGNALLISLIRDPSPAVRALASEALASLRPRGAADALRLAAQQDNADLVRIYAVRTLAEISPRPSASLFREVWDGSSDPDLRLEAFRGLLLSGSGDAWETAGLADADERIRFLAFQAWLARYTELRKRFVRPPDADFTARLEGFLGDRVGGIRELAKKQMEALGYRIRPSGFGYAVER